MVKLDSISDHWAKVLDEWNRTKYYERRAWWFHQCIETDKIIWPGQSCYECFRLALNYHEDRVIDLDNDYVYEELSVGWISEKGLLIRKLRGGE